MSEWGRVQQEHSWSLLSSLPAHQALVCPSDPTGRLPVLPVGRQSRGVRAGRMHGSGCCLTREQRGRALPDRGDVGGCCRIGGSVAQFRGTRAGCCQLGVQGYASRGASGTRVEGSNAGRSSGCSQTWTPQAPRSSGARCCHVGGAGCCRPKAQRAVRRAQRSRRDRALQSPTKGDALAARRQPGPGTGMPGAGRGSGSAGPVQSPESG